MHYYNATVYLIFLLRHDEMNRCFKILLYLLSCSLWEIAVAAAGLVRQDFLLLYRNLVLRVNDALTYVLLCDVNPYLNSI